MRESGGGGKEGVLLIFKFKETTIIQRNLYALNVHFSGFVFVI